LSRNTIRIFYQTLANGLATRVPQCQPGVDRFEFLAEKQAVADLKQASEVSSVAAADRACKHGPHAGWLQPIALEPNRKAVRKKSTKRRSSNNSRLSLRESSVLSRSERRL